MQGEWSETFIGGRSRCEHSQVGPRRCPDLGRGLYRAVDVVCVDRWICSLELVVSVPSVRTQFAVCALVRGTCAPIVHVRMHAPSEHVVACAQVINELR